ncbi:MAG: hypothetical protein JXQ76_01665 [Campylobacterales bacterium]|nr:hypothetical protein [Campylobacterales bacterium]
MASDNKHIEVKKNNIGIVNSGNNNTIKQEITNYISTNNLVVVIAFISNGIVS